MMIHAKDQFVQKPVSFSGLKRFLNQFERQKFAAFNDAPLVEPGVIDRSQLDQGDRPGSRMHLSESLNELTPSSGEHARNADLGPRQGRPFRTVRFGSDGRTISAFIARLGTPAEPLGKSS